MIKASLSIVYVVLIKRVLKTTIQDLWTIKTWPMAISIACQWFGMKCGLEGLLVDPFQCSYKYIVALSDQVSSHIPAITSSIISNLCVYKRFVTGNLTNVWVPPDIFVLIGHHCRQTAKACACFRVLEYSEDYAVNLSTIRLGL